jgi:peptidoglycan/LPS O-acetylase OafA/YrhL
MNFDYLRLFLAVTVMCGHLIYPALQFMPVWHNELAVLFFFCISGYLIAQSFMRDGNILRYVRNRVARIYPPIVVTVVALITFGLATGEGQAFIHGAFALLLLQDWYSLTKAGEPLYAHGAFWTIIIEVQFYVTLPLALILLRKRPRLTLALLAVLYIAAHFARQFLYVEAAEIGYRPQLLAFRDNLFTVSHFFIAGMLVALYAPKITDSLWFWIAILPLSIWLFIRIQVRGDEYLTYLTPLAMAMMVVAVARLCGFLGRTAPWGDISYGIYIYHFPVLTILALYEITDGWTAVAVTVVAAFASWHLVEKRILRRAKGLDAKPARVAIAPRLDPEIRTDRSL